MGNFKKYLTKQSTSVNLDPESEFFFGSVDCFLAVAARELVKDGMSAEEVAHLYTNAAIETLSRGGGRKIEDAAEEVISIGQKTLLMFSGESSEQ